MRCRLHRRREMRHMSFKGSPSVNSTSISSFQHGTYSSATSWDSHLCFLCLPTSLFPTADRFVFCSRTRGYWPLHFSSTSRKPGQNFSSIYIHSIQQHLYSSSPRRITSQLSVPALERLLLPGRPNTIPGLSLGRDCREENGHKTCQTE